MQTPAKKTEPPDPPDYYRWRDARSPLVVEVKIELVPRILADLRAAEAMGLEGGGVLTGCFPRSIGPPLLRIEEFETVGRRVGDEMPYILSAKERQEFTTARKRAARRELSAVGYFRSHLRTGGFELTIHDRDLMSAEFRNSLHVALLIGNDESVASSPENTRHLATYFVSVNGVIQNRVDPLVFRFEVADLDQMAPPQPSALGEGLAPAREVKQEATVVWTRRSASKSAARPVFLSYARPDVGKAREVYKCLTGGRMRVWMDEQELRTGQDWKAEIEKAIRASQVFVACFSTRSVGHRGFFQTELRTAYEVWKTIPPGKVFLLPIRLDDCEIPQAVQSAHCTDFFASDGPAKLVRDITAYLSTD
jgi:hypothetical protein